MALLGLFIIKAKNKVDLPKEFKTIAVIQLLVFVTLGVLHQDLFFISRYALFVIISYIVLLTLIRYRSLSKFLYLNNSLIVLQAVCGVIAFFLILFGFLTPLLDISENYNHIYCFGLTCTNAMFGSIIRVAGYFDEPGAMATWGIYALVFNKLFFENKKFEIMLMISLCFTLSMAYFIILSLYVLLFYRQKIKYMIPIIAVAIMSIFYIAQDSNSQLYALTIQRFMSDGSGHVETNRDILMEKAKTYFLKSPIIGNGETFIEQTDYMNDNPYETLAKSGILGTFAIYLPLFLVFLKHRGRGCFYGAIILAVCYLQRPFHIQLLHYLMLYSFYLMSYYYNSIKYAKTTQSINNNNLL